MSPTANDAAPCNPRAAEVRAAARRRISRRFAGGVLALFALLGVLSAALIQSAISYDRAVRRFTQEAALEQALAAVLQLVTDGETAQRGYVLTRDAEFARQRQRAQRVLPGALTRAERMLRAIGRADRAVELRDAVQRRMALGDRVMALTTRGDDAAAHALIASGEGRRRTARVRAVVENVRREREAFDRAARARAADARTHVGLGLGALLFCVVALAVRSLIVTQRDLAALDRAALLLEQSESRFRSLAEGAVDLVRIHGLDGRLRYVNPASQRLLGYSATELHALGPEALVHPDDRALVRRAIEEALATGEPVPRFEHRMRAKGGDERWFETSVEPVRDEHGAVVQFHSISRDITARRMEEAARETQHQELRIRAERDELTNLLNRRGFLERATLLLEDASAMERPVMLVFCDVDGLKGINDSYGHECGDRAIKDAAALLVASARATDVIARLGGDELVMLATVRDALAGRAFEARLRENLRRHNAVAERPYELSISVGHAFAEPGARVPVDALLAQADQAMYARKRARKKPRSAPPSDHARA